MAEGTTPKAKEIQQVIMSSGILKHVKLLRASGSGEPLASSLFGDLIRQLPVLDCHPNMELSLQTNGLLLSPDYYDEILMSGKPVREVLVSIDAATATTYKKLRGGNWNTLMFNLADLRRRNVWLQLNFVVQMDNFNEIPDFVKLAYTLGAQKVYFSVLGNWGTYTNDDYATKAVHLPKHPFHGELIRVLWEAIGLHHGNMLIALTNMEHLLQGGNTKT
jgi:MoaA/NifB/PqqE/SkfB family radical SAM enzyme